MAEDLAERLATEGVAHVAPDDGVEPLNPNLELEHATPKAALFRATDPDSIDPATLTVDLDGGGLGAWFPKSVLRVDPPEVFVLRKFVEDKDLWGLVA